LAKSIHRAPQPVTSNHPPVESSSEVPRVARLRCQLILFRLLAHGFLSSLGLDICHLRLQHCLLTHFSRPLHMRLCIGQDAT
jgi:hypothetical protein